MIIVSRKPPARLGASFSTGITLGNFDEVMGGATAALTGNPDNYSMGRDAVRQLQKEHSQRHPYIYGGAEFVGAMMAPMHIFPPPPDMPKTGMISD